MTEIVVRSFEGSQTLSQHLCLSTMSLTLRNGMVRFEEIYKICERGVKSIHASIVSKTIRVTVVTVNEQFPLSKKG